MTGFYGAIEAGGTRFVCALGALGNGPARVKVETVIATTTPEETIENVMTFFHEHHSSETSEALQAIGIASFGPLDLDRNSEQFGQIIATPKPGWSGVDIVGKLQRAFKVPVVIDTDVNGAALAEHRWGGARDLSDFVYLTIGTGIGAGIMVNGSLIHGLNHCEWGHIRVPHSLEADPFAGCCPFHGDCLEGLASGTAIEARWGKPAVTCPSDHPAWQLEAQYLAFAVHNLVCTLFPQKVILGGGIMEQKQLFPLIRTSLIKSLGGYFNHFLGNITIDNYIVPPALGRKSGLYGAFCLAQSGCRMK